MKIRTLAPAKINLCLFLGEARADGRHELVTLFESVSLFDSLTLETLERGDDQVVCPAVAGENLAARALGALRERGWSGPPVRIEIDKRIPIAAGMAGGSADAAAALRLAMAVGPGRAEEIDAIAAELGADVPAQLAPGLSIGRGAGELVEHASPLADHAIVVLPSRFELSTAAVYGEADRLALPRAPAELEELARSLLGALRPGARLPSRLIANDLQPAAVSLCPAVAQALEAALEAGAEDAVVCGSGPTVFGIWWGSDAPAIAAEAAARLSARFPGAVAAVPVETGVALPELIEP